MAFTDRTREKSNGRSLTGVLLLVFGVVAVIVALFFLRNAWPG